MMKRFLCAALALAMGGSAFGADIDWSDLSRKADDAARAVEIGQPATVDRTGTPAYYQNAMNQAAADGRTDVMDWLRQKGADVNAQADDGDTPIHAAARSGRTDSLDWLRRQGADVNVRGRNGDTALHSAASSGSIDAMHWLRRNNADASAVNNAGETVAHSAAVNDQDGVLDWLRRQTSDAVTSDEDTRSNLRNAPARGNVDATGWLRDQGIDVNRTPATGYETSRRTGARRGGIDAAQWLRDHDVDVNTSGADTRYPVGGGRTAPFGRSYDQVPSDNDVFDNSNRTTSTTGTDGSRTGAGGWLKSILGDE